MLTYQASLYVMLEGRQIRTCTQLIEGRERHEDQMLLGPHVEIKRKQEKLVDIWVYAGYVNEGSRE